MVRSHSDSSSDDASTSSPSSTSRKGLLASIFSESAKATLLACLRGRNDGESRRALTPFNIICVGFPRIVFHSSLGNAARIARTLDVSVRCSSTDASRTKPSPDQVSRSASVFASRAALARATSAPRRMGRRIVNRKSAGRAARGAPFRNSNVSHSANRVASHAQYLSRSNTRKTKSRVRQLQFTLDS